MKSAAVGNPQSASQWQRIDAPISVMFPRLKLTLNRAKSARSGIWSVGKQREWTWGCNISVNFSITSCFSLHTEICLLSLQSCLILLLLGNCERQLLAKSYSGTKSRPVMQHHQQIGLVFWKGWNAVQNYLWVFLPFLLLIFLSRESLRPNQEGFQMQLHWVVGCTVLIMYYISTSR